MHRSSTRLAARFAVAILAIATLAPIPAGAADAAPQAGRAPRTGSASSTGGDSTPPTVGTPVARVRVGGTVTGDLVPFTIAWTGSDPSGIERFRLQQQLDGGSWQTIRLPSPTARSVHVGLRPPHEYRFRVRATDRAGNTGDDVALAAFRVRRYSEQAHELATTGPWTLASDTSFLGDRALRSGTAGAEATFEFSGSQVAWFGTRGPAMGKARVYVDGAYRMTVDLERATTGHRRVLFRAAWTASGPHTLRIRVTGSGKVEVDGLVVVDPPAPDPVLVGAGDIAYCSRTQQAKTAALLDRIAGRVFAAGDLAYPGGTTAQFRDCYGPTWGRWRLRTSPVPGNHEYHASRAAPYFAYFGSRAGTAGEGWYAYDLGTWRVYHLNANCDHVGCGAGSRQVTWLAADLAAHPRACVAAVWHEPLFSSGEHGGDPKVRPLWEALEDAGADVVLNGHDHDYERFAPQTSGGQADPNGIREFVVGTGGAALRPFPTTVPNSEARTATTYGVLKLTLRTGGYDWRFLPVAGARWTDSGSADCH